MLNAIPDTRNADDMSEIFLAPNEELQSDRKDEKESDEKLSVHETIDLPDRQKSSVFSSESVSSSSVEVPQRDPEGDTGK